MEQPSVTFPNTTPQIDKKKTSPQEVFLVIRLFVGALITLKPSGFSLMS